MRKGIPKSEAARAFGVIISSVQRYLATGLSSKLAGWEAAGFMLGVVGCIVIHPCLEMACLIGPIPTLSAKRGTRVDILVYKPKALYYCHR